MDTNKRILFVNDEGGVSIIVPAANCNLTIEQVALKDVPKGKPFKIVNVSEVPTDRTFRGAWEVTIDSPDGFGIGHDEWYSKQ